MALHRLHPNKQRGKVFAGWFLPGVRVRMTAWPDAA